LLLDDVMSCLDDEEPSSVLEPVELLDVMSCLDDEEPSFEEEPVELLLLAEDELTFEEELLEDEYSVPPPPLSLQPLKVCAKTNIMVAASRGVLNTPKNVSHTPLFMIFENIVSIFLSPF
jgi:hypothetical protein